MLISVYTDGSCKPIEKIGSYGYVITAKRNNVNHLKKHSSGKYVDTTVNRMELKAIIKALENIEPGHTIDIYSDSQYCINGINIWIFTWIRKNELHKKVNPGLWQRLLTERQRHLDNGSTLNFTWVRAHNGNTFNEMADKLACIGSNKRGGGVSCKANN